MQPFQLISTSSLWRKSPIYLNELLQIKQKYLNTSLEDYLQVNVYPDLVVMEQEE